MPTNNPRPRHYDETPAEASMPVFQPENAPAVPANRPRMRISFLIKMEMETGSGGPESATRTYEVEYRDGPFPLRVAGTPYPSDYNFVNGLIIACKQHARGQTDNAAARTGKTSVRAVEPRDGGA